MSTQNQPTTLGPIQFYAKKDDLDSFSSQMNPDEKLTGYVLSIGTNPKTGTTNCLGYATFKNIVTNIGRTSNDPIVICPYPPECLEVEGFVNPLFTTAQVLTIPSLLNE